MNRFNDVDVNKADLNTKSMYVQDQKMTMTMTVTGTMILKRDVDGVGN